MELSRPIVAVAATAALLSGCVEAKKPDALPQPTGILWELDQDGNPDNDGNLIAEMPEEGGSEYFIDPDVPEEHFEAIEASLENPILKYALSKGYADSIRFVTDYTDNGSFDAYDNKSVVIEVGDRLRSRRMYTHDVAIDWVVTHQAAHSVFMPWMEVIRDQSRGVDDIYPESLRNKVSGLIDSCNDLRVESFDLFVNQNKDDATGFLETVGGRRLERGKESVALDGKFDDIQRRRDLASGAILVSLAEDIRSGGVYDGEVHYDSGCERLGLEDIMHEEMRELDDKIGVDFPDGDFEHDLLQGLYDSQTDQYRGDSRHSYSCVTDGKGIDDLVVNSEETSNRNGRPYSDVSELLASSFAALFLNPPYLRSCIEGLEPVDQKAIINVLAGMIDILEETDPRLLNIIGGQSGEHFMTTYWIKSEAAN